jgi:hypothetical protein
VHFSLSSALDLKYLNNPKKKYTVNQQQKDFKPQL